MRLDVWPVLMMRYPLDETPGCHFTRLLITNVTRTWSVDEAEAHGEHGAHETVGKPRLLEIHPTTPLRHTTQSRVCGVDYVQARPCECDDLTMDGLVRH